MVRDGRGRAIRAVAAGAGAVIAIVPALVSAADGEGRTLDAPADFGRVALFTLLGAGSVLLLASLGRMYQRQRGIRWRFQDPDSPQGGGH